MHSLQFSVFRILPFEQRQVLDIDHRLAVEPDLYFTCTGGQLDRLE